MPMRKLSGRPCLNIKKGETSYIVLTSDTEGDFTKDTEVERVYDSLHTFVWYQAKKPQISDKGRRLKVRIKADKGHEKEVDPPDTGKVTVTITKPDDTTEKVEVDYILETP